MSLINTGGQTLAHNMRMMRQVLKYGLGASFFSFIMTSLLFLHNLNFIFCGKLFFYRFYSFIAKIIGLSHIDIDSNFVRSIGLLASGKTQVIAIEKLDTAILPLYFSLLEIVLESFWVSFAVSIVVFGLFLLMFFVRGKRIKRIRHISGRKLISPTYLSLKIKLFRKASNLKLGPLNLLKNSETKHFLVTGGTGSGKTNCLNHILQQIQKRGERAIIVDTEGSFVSRFHREGVDTILSPFDKRSKSWSPWQEINSDKDYDSIAEGFIPNTYSENEAFWRNSAQVLLSALLKKLSSSNKISDLTRWILNEPLENLCAFLEGTDAAGHIDIKSERTASSIRSVAAQYIKCLTHLKDSEDPFSIKKWLQSEDSSWLFISCKTEELTSIRPLLSCWISVSIDGLLSMGQDLDRRVWFILDEIPSLNRVSSLDRLVTLGRKYGACSLLSLQSPSQMDAIYGSNITKTIIGNCATRIVFSDNDPEVAHRISKAFGECEIEEPQEGISYGANEIRDGVNLSSVKKLKPVVSANSIQSLKENEAYIKLPGNWPITKVHLKVFKNNTLKQKNK
ncbi:ATPase, T2SS/T4P/T4SS family [Chlamydiales bacterium]|nr:ATPase, T2SS/T4P/T4SS family [Chlamydiales bacterium]